MKSTKIEKNKLLPTDILNDERNSIRYTKSLSKKAVISSNVSVVGTRTGSILINRKKGALDTALSYIVEDDSKVNTTSIPLQVEPEKSIVPDIFLSKSATTKHVPKDVKIESNSKIIPGYRDFVLSICSVLEKLPYGPLLLDKTIKRKSEILFKDQQLNIWCLQGIYV